VNHEAGKLGLLSSIGWQRHSERRLAVGAIKGLDWRHNAADLDPGSCLWGPTRAPSPWSLIQRRTDPWEAMNSPRQRERIERAKPIGAAA
jgi:hypothetical protein